MKSNYRKYLIEGTMIVFSVFFALLINKMFDLYQLEKKKTIALESITKELYRNEAIVKEWKEKHSLIRNKISSILSGKMTALKWSWVDTII